MSCIDPFMLVYVAQRCSGQSSTRLYYRL